MNYTSNFLSLFLSLIHTHIPQEHMKRVIKCYVIKKLFL